MSGGSYDYLCHKSPGELFGCIGQLTLMQARLAELGYEDAAAATAHTVRLLGQCYEQTERQAAAISEVWRAVEWCDSGDWSEDQVANVVKEWRSEGGRGRSVARIEATPGTTPRDDCSTVDP